MLTQRLGSANQKKDEYIDNIVKIIKENPGSCDEVWFATDYGYPPVSEHKKTAEILKKQAEKFKNIGVRISLQVSNTIGHGEYMKSRDCSGLVYDGSPAECLVGDDGAETKYSFCWRGENFRKYMLETVKIYAETLKPYAIWFDDDLRAINHAPVPRGCFCDACIAKFNKMHGVDFTREQLVHEMSFGDVKWRKAYTDFVCEGLYDFIYEMCRVLHEASPDTTASLQHGAYGGYYGGKFAFLFDAMKAATGKNPGTRPGAGAYDDYDPNEFVKKGNDIGLQNRLLPDYVTEIRPEIESLPDVTYGKTIPGTCLETSYYFAHGSTAMSYAILMNDYEPFSWHGEMFDEFAKHRKYWEKMVDINYQTIQDGVHIVIGETTLEAKCEEAFDYARIASTPLKEAELQYVNVPLSYNKGGDVFLLTDDYAKTLTDKEVTELMSKPVLTDAKSIEILSDRGFDFGIKVHQMELYRVVEVFEDHPVNSGFAGEKSGKFIWTTQGYYIEDLNGTAECIGRYMGTVENVPEDGKIANALITTQAGGKWVVQGYNGWNKIISNSKRNQLLNAIEYISGKPISARMITPFKAVLLPRIYKENGKLACVSLLNCTVGDASPEIRLNVPEGTKLTYMSQYYPETALTAGKDGVVKVPHIAAWSVGTIFIDD